MVNSPEIIWWRKQLRERRSAGKSHLHSL
jgi:hypothetical protein